jgi:hypothetical protein
MLIIHILPYHKTNQPSTDFYQLMVGNGGYSSALRPKRETREVKTGRLDLRAEVMTEETTA